MPASDQAATLVTSHRIGPDGAPIATSPSYSRFDRFTRLWVRRQRRRRRQQPRRRSGRKASQLQQRRPLPLHPIQRRLWLRRQRRRPRRQPRKRSSRTGRQLQQRHPPPPRPLRRIWLRRRSRTPRRQPLCRTKFTEPSQPKIDLKKKPLVKTALQKPRTSPKPPAKSLAPIERQSTDPAPPKEAEKSPQPTQEAGSPTALAPVKTTSVQQRVADGMTHAFGYLVHLPGALIPHLGGPNPDGH